MSAIGNYELVQPSKAMVQAYGALFAWKLSLHGVDASSTQQWVGSKDFQAINGHRDAAATACPGKYLYAKIPEIRTLAAEAQRGWAGRELESNLAGTPHPDLVVRRASDGQGFIIPTGGLTALRLGVAAADRARRGRPRRWPRPTSPATASATSWSAAAGRRAPRSAPATATARSAPAIKQTNAVRRARPDHRRRRPQRRRPQRPGRARDRDRPARRATSAAATAGSAVAAARHRLERLHDAGRRRRRERRRQGRPAGPGRAPARLWLHAGHRQGPVRRRGSRCPGDWSGLRHDHRHRRLQQRRPRRPVRPRGRQSKYGYVLPANGDGTFGHPLGPVTRLKSVGSLLGATNVLGDGTPDLVVRTGGRGRGAPEQRHLRDRPADRRPGPTCPTPTWCSTPATGTATASAT